LIPTATGRFALGDLALESGKTLPGAFLSWKSYGTLSAARDNVVLYPTSYGATHGAQEWLIGPDGILDPTRWFVVTPDMFTNGLSSSPSNTPGWPGLVTTADNVFAQQRLLREVWGITHLHGVYGFSMGAQQAYHWAALCPEKVAHAIVVCGSARTSVHNQVFLRSLMAVLRAAPEYVDDARFSSEPDKAKRAFGRIYAGWALSQDFYRANLHLTALGAPDLETFLTTQWEDRFAGRPAADHLAQLQTWDAGDISRDPRYGGDLVRALGAIQARTLLLPGATDLYFRVADNEAELPHLRHAELRPIPSLWGHRAGNPSVNPADAAFLKDAVRGWLG
jgi:homoserine O-acetyltransferase